MYVCMSEYVCVCVCVYVCVCLYVSMRVLLKKQSIYSSLVDVLITVCAFRIVLLSTYLAGGEIQSKFSQR